MLTTPGSTTAIWLISSISMILVNFVSVITIESFKGKAPPLSPVPAPLATMYRLNLLAILTHSEISNDYFGTTTNEGKDFSIDPSYS